MLLNENGFYNCPQKKCCSRKKQARPLHNSQDPFTIGRSVVEELGALYSNQDPCTAVRTLVPHSGPLYNSQDPCTSFRTLVLQ